MSDHTPSPATRIVTGVAAGLVAGLAASLAMDLFQRATQQSDDSEPATQKAADGIARDITGEPLGGQLVHYGLGAALGVGYGVAAEIAPAATAGFGTVFATGVWTTLDEAAVPALQLGDPPWKASPSTQAYNFASHLVFGIAAEASRRIARRAIARRSTNA